MREPIARNFSMMFQGIQNWGIGKLAQGNESFSMTKITEEYIKDCQSSTFDWFDDEIKQVFGVDIYQHPFDIERGYEIIQGGNVEIFIYKLEKSEEIGNALGEFLGVDNFKLLKKHESSKEPHRFIYNELKQMIHIPKEILDRIYNDKRMKHFYSEDEIKAFYRKWI